MSDQRPITPIPEGEKEEHKNAEEKENIPESEPPRSSYTPPVRGPRTFLDDIAWNIMIWNMLECLFHAIDNCRN